MHELAMAIGIVGGLVSYEILGLLPGGIVTPGYLALFVDQPIRIAGTLIVSLLTYAGIKGLSCFVILFGRRRFALTMLMSFLLRWGWDVLVGEVLISVPELRVVGFIVPGLIAVDFERQGIFATLCTMTIVTTLVRLVLMSWSSLFF